MRNGGQSTKFAWVTLDDSGNVEAMLQAPARTLLSARGVASEREISRAQGTFRLGLTVRLCLSAFREGMQRPVMVSLPNGRH